ncbi:MAG: 1-deoxy-D-xylulose-5-phosphate reductoisomerase [Alphaproteobacteria bacterium]|nr:MAG: 1-deoxy-D-xylulose-5-phosphate reductoisomerase [Alphaproteobacteria bacterium]
MSARRITILGATGSIGDSAADIILRDRDRFSVHAVTANGNAAALAKRAISLGAAKAVVADEQALPALRDALAGTSILAAAGQGALQEAAADPVDIVLAAIVGAAGVRPTVAAVSAGNAIALANKECLICAGAAFMKLVRDNGVTLLPVDSEHNALFQLIEGRNTADILTYTITASGGPFRTWTADRLAVATRKQALAHPIWSMGDKLTIDSATLMNKGLELIEAMHLFDLPPEKLDVLVHPQSVVHALTTFVDGSVHAEMGAPDMRRPIAYCLHWPDRCGWAPATLDLAKVGELTFEQPDPERFPSLRIAREAMQRGDGAPTVLNAANEVAVQAFLHGRLGFTQLPAIVEETIIKADSRGLLYGPATIDDALELDRQSRIIARGELEKPFAEAS